MREFAEVYWKAPTAELCAGAIAECAENAESIEELRGLRVNYSQGYGVSQPQKVQRAAIT
jgi:EAL domain-containing protein (putative c-di-GMP-specific phosphodiesterase class I)